MRLVSVVAGLFLLSVVVYGVLRSVRASLSSDPTPVRVSTPVPPRFDTTANPRVTVTLTPLGTFIRPTLPPVPTPQP